MSPRASTRFGALFALASALLSWGCAERDSFPVPEAGPTYYGEVRSILEAKCNDCHRDGGFAPFSLTDEADARKAAGAIKAEVVAKRMPPWMPDDACNRYLDQASLSDEQIDTVRRWVDAGAPSGDASLPGPPIPHDVDGLPRVDVALELPVAFKQTTVPDQLHCFALDWPVDHPTFITGFDASPGEPRVVHHISAYIVTPEHAADVADIDGAHEGVGWDCFGGPRVESVEIASWVPGFRGYAFAPDTGYRIEPGSKIIAQMHYNSDQRGPAPDRSTLLFKTDDKVVKEALIYHYKGPNWPKTLDIRANDPDTAVKAAIDTGFDEDRDISLTNLHMHYLGSSAKMSVLRENGERECLLKLDAWNFHWQQGYMLEEQVTLHPGDRLEVECHWDNSAAHQPLIDGVFQTPKDTGWGIHSTQEMCLGSVITTRHGP